MKVRSFCTGLAVIVASLVLLSSGVLANGKALTHLGVNPDDIVTLYGLPPQGENGFVPMNFMRLYPKGTSPNEPYVVPSGKLLIITDIELQSLDEGPGAFRLRANNVFVYYAYVGMPRGRIADHLTAGIVVPPGETVYGEVTSIDQVYLRGYLINPK
jgi:hypothetical protein